MIVYGIPNCNTVKKALLWLKDKNISYSFHDFKKSGITAAKLNAWSKEVGWEQLLNKKGLTWRNLPLKEKEEVTDQKSAVRIMMERPSVIKRPVIEYNGKIVVGYDDDLYKELLK